MEPQTGVWASIWHFIRFLPYFIGLLILGIIKGIIFCPWICLFMTLGNASIILGLWPAHLCWTYYCILSAKQVGPVLKLVLCPCILVLLILYPVFGILASIIGGAVYGFLSPVFATFDAVGEGKPDKFRHCIYDGTWSTVLGCFTVIRDLSDVCFHSYFSIMDDLRNRGPPDAKYHEIRILDLLGAIISGVLGVLVDIVVISLLALFKSPYMLFKGWNRLLHDLIGREGPFLDTMCVPFAGLAIILWPLAVVGAVLGSIVSSVALGAYAGVVAYQESSAFMGFRYIVASLAIYDEYSNDVVDLPEGTCFPRPPFRKKDLSLHNQTHGPAISRPTSLQRTVSRTGSMKNPLVELTPIQLLDSLFKECQHHGEILVSEGLISAKDIEDAKSGKDNDIMNIGLLAYCILQTLIHSAKSNSAGLLLSDISTEITSTNRPKGRFFDWFLNPLLILKEQIKAKTLSPMEEDYLQKLVLFGDDSERLRHSFAGNPPEAEVRRAEIEALARRLRGITKSISRYPTVRRRFENISKSMSECLMKKNNESQSYNGASPASKPKNGIVRFLSERSFSRKRSDGSPESESGNQLEKDVEIQ